ncbi:MAG: autotransporter outer membrane beta-barrel domain-containing protein, partial [Sphingopyxis sp.]
TIRIDAGIVAPEPEPEPEPEDPGEQTRARSARGAFIIAEVPDIEASHRFTNAGSWNSIGGINVFGGVDDVLVNVAGGRLIGGTAAATAETTTYSGLETLTNQGIITMVDGGIGDAVRTSGDASFAAGSLLAVDAGGSGSDRFIADGATTIAAGARLQVSNPQAAVLGTRYTVLESAGGVTGSFTFADQLLSNFLGYRQGRTATTIFVELAKLRAFAAAGITPNQIAVGTALDGQAATDPLAAATLLLPSDAAAQAAFDGLSGEIHPSVRTAMIEESRLPRNAVLERLDGRNGGAVWGQLFGNWGDSDGANGTADLDRETIGGVLGADFAVGDSAMIGVAGSYLETDVDARARNSSAKLKSWHVLGYAGVQFGGAALKVGGGYASASIDTDRAVAFPGIGQRLVAGYDGSLVHGFADLGYRLPLGGGHVEPFAQIVAVRADTDAFAETGGSAAVAGAKSDENATLSTLGARFSTATSGVFSVSGTVGWQHGFGDLTPATSMRFATGPGFTVIGTPRSRDAGVATIDARLRLGEGAQITVSYDGVIGSAGQDHSIKAGLRIAF